MIDKIARKKEESEISTAYKFFLEGELSGEEFRDILKARGYTVVIEGASRQKLGFYKGAFYSLIIWLTLSVIFYVVHTILLHVRGMGLL